MRFTTATIALRAGYVLATFVLSPLVSYAVGNPEAGQDAFTVCAGCDSTSPGANMRGASLAVTGHTNEAAVAYRYSAATTSPGVVRNDEALDKQGAALPPQNGYRSHSLHRLSRGCGFHFNNLRHGLSC